MSSSSWRTHMANEHISPKYLSIKPFCRFELSGFLTAVRCEKFVSITNNRKNSSNMCISISPFISNTMSRIISTPTSPHWTNPDLGDKKHLFVMTLDTFSCIKIKTLISPIFSQGLTLRQNRWKLSDVLLQDLLIYYNAFQDNHVNVYWEQLDVLDYPLWLNIKIINYLLDITAPFSMRHFLLIDQLVDGTIWFQWLNIMSLCQHEL